MSLLQSNARSVTALIAGTIVCELLLYGPSLVGGKILAPTDLLVVSGVLGVDPRRPRTVPENALLLDPVEVIYPGMAFAAGELRAGRLPLWNPYTYCGSPFLASHPSAVFQPFAFPFYVWPDPRMFVWIHLLKSVVASLGTFLFLRELRVSHWAAVMCGLCFSHVGYFVAWLSFPLSACAVWLPWGFLAVESIVKRPGGWGGPGLSVVTGILLVSGHLETAAQIFTAIGAYGAWRWLESLRSDGWNARTRTSLIVGILSVAIGFGVGSIQLLPTAEYLRSSLRMLQRRAGLLVEDAPSDRLAELIRVCFPYLLGTWQRDSHPIVPTTFNESSVNGHVGFTLLVLLAPLGVVQDWRQPATWFWVLLGLASAAALFRIPILDLWVRIPPFDLMRGNRMMLITGWAALVMGARGIDSLAERRPGQLWVGAAAALVAALCALGLLYVLIGQPPKVLSLVTQRAWPCFRAHAIEYVWISALGASCVSLWIWIPRFARVAAILLPLLALGELVGSERGYNPQMDRSTYYPDRGPIRYMVDRVDDGRVCGLRGMLTPNIGVMYGLRDVRGYDSVDPLPYLELLRLADSGWAPRPSYAVTRSFWSGPSPVLDMLGVQYFISRVALDTSWEQAYQGDGLWVYRSPSALPRVYIPHRVVIAAAREERLRILADSSFDPRDVVVISEPFRVPATESKGTAELIDELPCRLRIRVRADTESVVVLADSWSPGWSVSVDGEPAQALQANHALRAVRVPAGDHMIEWVYSPATVRLGIWISLGALLALFAWCLVPQKFWLRSAQKEL